MPEHENGRQYVEVDIPTRESNNRSNRSSCREGLTLGLTLAIGLLLAVAGFKDVIKNGSLYRQLIPTNSPVAEPVRRLLEDTVDHNAEIRFKLATGKVLAMFYPEMDIKDFNPVPMEEASNTTDTKHGGVLEVEHAVIPEIQDDLSPRDYAEKWFADGNVPFTKDPEATSKVLFLNGVNGFFGAITPEFAAEDDPERRLEIVKIFLSDQREQNTPDFQAWRESLIFATGLHEEQVDYLINDMIEKDNTVSATVGHIQDVFEQLSRQFKTEGTADITGIVLAEESPAVERPFRRVFTAQDSEGNTFWVSIYVSDAPTNLINGIRGLGLTYNAGEPALIHVSRLPDGTIVKVGVRLECGGNITVEFEEVEVTPTVTPTALPTSTPTSTLPWTRTPTFTPTSTLTRVPTETPTQTPTVTVTPTDTPTSTPTSTPEPTKETSPTPTITLTPTPYSIKTTTPRPTPDSTPQFTSTPFPTPPEPDRTPIATDTPLPDPTELPEPTDTPIPQPTSTRRNPFQDKTPSPNDSGSSSTLETGNQTLTDVPVVLEDSLTITHPYIEKVNINGRIVNVIRRFVGDTLAYLGIPSIEEVIRGKTKDGRTLHS